MSSRLIIDGNAVYEIDEDCAKRQRTGYRQGENEKAREVRETGKGAGRSRNR